MELNVTHMVKDCDEMPLLYGSVFELGDNAGTLTWNNSQRYAKEHPLLADDQQIEEARDFFRQMGFGDDADKWSIAEVQAVMVQEVASAIREMEAYDTDDEYLAAAQRGEVRGDLWRLSEGSKSEWYYHVGY